MKNILETIFEQSPESHVKTDGGIFLCEDAKVSVKDVMQMLRDFGRGVAEEQVKLCAAWATATLNADSRASDSLTTKRFDLFSDCVRVKI